MVEPNNFLGGAFTVRAHIGYGGFNDVYLITDGNQVPYAAKILKIAKENPRNIEEFINEAIFLNSMNHPRILRCFEHGRSLFRFKVGAAVQRYYMVLELAERNCLLDYIIPRNRRGFRERVARFYFRQLTEGLQYIHGNNISNRDLKPDNLLLTNDFDLKIADFGFATTSSTSTETLGTVNYQAPEIIAKQVYDPQKADIFSAGVVLFILVCGHPPFDKASSRSSYYKPIREEDSVKFWNRNHGELYDADFKELCFSMLLSEELRPSLEDIINNPWYQREVADRQSVEADLTEFADILIQPEEEKQNLDPTRGSSVGTSIISLDSISESFLKLFPKQEKIKENTEKRINRSVNLVVPYRPEELVSIIGFYAKMNDITVEAVEGEQNQYTVDLNFKAPSELTITAETFIAESKKTYVQFSKKTGDYFAYFFEVQEILNFLQTNTFA